MVHPRSVMLVNFRRRDRRIQLIFSLGRRFRSRSADKGSFAPYVVILLLLLLIIIVVVVVLLSTFE